MVRASFGITVILLAASLVGGCFKVSTSGPKYSKPETLYYPQKQQKIDAAKEPTSLFATSSLNCGSSECPASVGMLTVRVNSNQVTNCTAFLVSDSVMATNDHCLPVGLTAGHACDQVGEVVFARTASFAGEKRKCQSVLWRSGDGDEERKVKIDLAYFKIAKKVWRPALHTDSAAINQNDVFTIYKVDPPATADLLQGTLQVDQCRALFGTSDLPFLTETDSPAFILAKVLGGAKPCNLMPGNSGAPFVDQNDAVKGILRMTAVSNQQRLGLTTSASCLPSYMDATAPLPPSCDLATDKSKYDELASSATASLFSKVIAPRLDAAANNWGARNYPELRWKIQQTKFVDSIGLEESAYIPVPACSSGTLINAEDAVSLPEFTYALNPDEDFKPVATIATNENKFNAMLKIKTGFVTLTVLDSGAKRQVLFESQVRPCISIQK